MKEHRQTVMKILGEGGCYLLCLVRAAEEVIGHRIDAVGVFLEALEEGRAREDCWLHSPEMILSAMTGIRWAMDKRSVDYKCQPGQVEILRYERIATVGLIGHFVLGDGEGKIKYNPLETSLTVEKGQLVSKRVFSRLA